MAATKKRKEATKEKVDLIKSLRKQGKEYKEIRSFIKRQYGLTKTQVYYYVSIAIKEEEENLGKNLAGKKDFIESEIYDIYDQCREKGDLKTALLCLDKLRTIYGVGEDINNTSTPVIVIPVVPANTWGVSTFVEQEEDDGQ